MQQKDCFELGKITRTHGLQGDVVIYLDVDNPEEYANLDILLLEIRNKLLPYTLTSFNLYKTKQAIVNLEEVKSLEEAEALQNTRLFLPLDVLPNITEDDNFYLHEVINFDIIDQNMGKLGFIKEFIETGVQNLINMEYKNQEILIPLNDEIVLTINREKKELYTNLPKGLIEVYLEQDKTK